MHSVCLLTGEGVTSKASLDGHMVGYALEDVGYGTLWTSDLGSSVGGGGVMANHVIFDMGWLVDKMSVYDMKG